MGRAVETIPSREVGNDLVPLLIAAAALQVLIGGVRFVDGTMLMQFANVGFDAKLNDFSQYLFDSPMKILLLWLLPMKSATAIAVFFLGLCLLPLAAIWLVAETDRERIQLSALITLLPIWKVMFQNVTVGDSVTISCVMLMIMARRVWLVVIAGAFLLVWHFQQGLLASLIIMTMLLLSSQEDRTQRLIALGVGVALGCSAFLAFSLLLSPPHSGRMQFIFTHMAPFLTRNVQYLPIALCVLIPGAIIVHEAIRAGTFSTSWNIKLLCLLVTLLAIAASAVTTDFSRALLLLTFPMVLTVANPRLAGGRAYDRLLARPTIICLLAISPLMPILSWSGIDYFLWTGLSATIRKY